MPVEAFSTSLAQATLLSAEARLKPRSVPEPFFFFFSPSSIKTSYVVTIARSITQGV